MRHGRPTGQRRSGAVRPVAAASATFFQMRGHGILGDAQNSGSVANAAAVAGHGLDRFLDARLVGPIGIRQLECPAAILASTARMPALSAVPLDVNARAIFAMNDWRIHNAPSYRNINPLASANRVYGAYIWSNMPPSEKCAACALFQPPKVSSIVNRLRLLNCLEYLSSTSLSRGR